MDWMTERIDLSEFYLSESLIDSCDSEDPPSSPEELIASLESQIDLDSQPVAADDTTSPPPPVCVPEINQLSNLLFTWILQFLLHSFPQYPVKCQIPHL